jgi:Protein of unknown function (DUF4231)
MKSQDDIKILFDQLADLTPTQKETITHRYMFVMRNYVWRCRLYTFLYYMFRLIITVGSLSVPALLSLNSAAATAAATNDIYWFTWAVSLSVTTANGLTTLFKLDRRYYMLHATAERLRSETWQYVQLSGRYSGYYGSEKPTHANQYIYYCGQLEKLHMKQVNDEFLKNLDMGTSATGGGGSMSGQPQQQTTAAGQPQFANTVLVPESRDMRKDSAPDMFDIPQTNSTPSGGRLPPLHPRQTPRYATSLAVIYPEPAQTSADSS